MFAKSLQQNFLAIGADVRVVADADNFEIDLRLDGEREVFDVRLPRDGSITAKVLDLDRRQRHLVLDVTHRAAELSQRYLCGHDEFHWFVAALPERPEARTVVAAMESLKPRAVLDEQDRKRVKRSRRRRRRTTAYVRQGEWFFLPRPQFRAVDLTVQHNAALVRGAGKPHRVESLCRLPSGKLYARGAIAHHDHAAIHLDVWHEVFQNTEAQPQVMRPAEAAPAFDMKYLD